MKVVFEGSKSESDTIRTFFFRPEKPVHFTAGQFTELTIRHDNPDERGIKRWFTLSSAPGEELLTITTRYAGDDKSSSFKKALWSLKPDTEVHMAEPMGDFVLPKLIQTPLIFVVGGIGITPVHSILSWLTGTDEKREIKLLYGVQSEEDIIFQDTLAKAGVHPVIAVSQPSDAWGGERGRITAELILGLEKPSSETLIYISGPDPMVDTLSADLKKAGYGKQLVLDGFANYKDY